MMRVSSLQKQQLIGIIMAIFLIFVGQSDAMETKLKGQIVFSTYNELYIMDLKERQSWENPTKVPLPHKLDVAKHPSWMPQGNSVIFKYISWDKDIDKAKSYIAVIDLKDKSLTSYEDVLNSKMKYLEYPKWSPNDRLLAIINYELSGFIKVKGGVMRDAKPVNRLVIYDKTLRKSRSMENIEILNLPFSWSPDSDKIAYHTNDGEIAVCYIDEKTRKLDIGRHPVFHPINKNIYYIGNENHLYRINSDGSDRFKVDDGDWEWFQLIGISKDGRNLFYIEGGGFLLWEFSTIGVFDLTSHKKKRLSKRIAVINGASLYED